MTEQYVARAVSQPEIPQSRRWRVVFFSLLTGLLFAGIVAACAFASSDSIQKDTLTRLPPLPGLAPTAFPCTVCGTPGWGQSLENGTHSTPTTDASDNWMLSNDAGYILSDGGLTPISGWYMQALKAPERPNVFSSSVTNDPYPLNMPGEGPDVTFANCVQAVGLDAGYPSFTTGVSNVAVGGAPFSYIEQFGTLNSFQAAVNEATVYTELVADAGGNFAEIAIELGHGQADGNNANYGADIYTLNQQANGDGGLAQATGQDASIPFVGPQQNAFPQIGGGQNYSALGQVAANAAHPNNFILSGPQMQRPAYSDNAHYPFASAQLQGETDCHAYWQWWSTGSWTPLKISSATINTSTLVVTVNLAVPYGPIAAATTWVGGSSVTAPHGAGKTYGSGGAQFPSSNGWTGAWGFGLWNCGVNGVPIAIVSGPTITSNPSGANVTATITMTASSLADTIEYAHTPDDTTGGDYTGGCASGNPSGRCGIIRDSDPWAPPSWFVPAFSGVTQHNWLVEQVVSL